MKVNVDSNGTLLPLTEKPKISSVSSPRLLYTVPIGQNPSGLTTSEQRKKAIYAICVEFDIIIGEDDPYYILQEGEYVPRNIRAQKQAQTSSEASNEIEAFIETLEPSYLR